MDRYVRKVLNYQNIIIYGEGIVGRRTFQELKRIGIENRVLCFVKSEKKFEPYIIDGIEVRSVYDVQQYYKNTVFLLAVGDRHMQEIKATVKQLRIKHYLDARKVYLDSCKRSDFILKLRKIRNELYKKLEGRDCHTGTQNVQAVHITYCVTENAGDTVLSQCVRRFLKFRKWKIKSVTQKVDDGLIEEINQSDVLVIGGGGLFLPDTNANNISGWQWAVSNEQIEQIESPIIIYSVGYNYFKGQENTELFVSSINNIVKKADFVGLRNWGSVESIKKIVADDLKEKIVYQPCTTTLIRKIYNISPNKDAKTVMFNVAFDREDRRYGENKDIILHQIAKAAFDIQSKGYSIVYVAHSDTDLQFLPYLDQENVRYQVKNLTQSLPREVFRVYQNAAVVIGMRGHAQMIPFGIGVRIISLGTHDKMRWFLQDVNMEECYVDLNEECSMISNRIVTIFTDIVIKHPEKMDNRLREEQEKLWKISCENRTKIVQLINTKTNM